MNTDGVITALLTALEQNPDDHDVRLHLAEVMLTNDDYQNAADHFGVVLAKEPANLKALQGAAKAEQELGNEAKAAGYIKLLNALGEVANPTESSISNESSDNISKLTTDNPNVSRSDSPAKIKAVGEVNTDSENVTVGPWEDFEPPVTLDDVGGMENVKKRLNMAFLAPLKNPEIMKMYGKSLKGGMLLYGPPGCGKTFIARALAGELGATFMSVGLSDVLDMWLGESERKLHELFEAARRKSPAVLFFDEIDALGQKRSQLKHSGGRTIVNQLLAELDSIDNDNKNLFILGATNHPWDVDTALRRPGRFDRVTLVLPPDLEARVSIIDYHLRDRPVEDINLQQLAAGTEHFSGADLAHLCESAVEYAMHDSIETGNVRAITMQDFAKAIADIQPSTRPWFETARNYAMFANEGGVYDDLLEYIQTQKI